LRRTSELDHEKPKASSHPNTGIRVECSPLLNPSKPLCEGTGLLPPISIRADNKSAVMDEKAGRHKGESVLAYGVGLWCRPWSHAIGWLATPFRAEGVR
jgi:hypothetical protein